MTCATYYLQATTALVTPNQLHDPRRRLSCILKLLLLIKFNVHIEPLVMTDTWPSAVAVGLCLQVIPTYLLYDHSSPFPRPTRLPAPGPLGQALLGVQYLLGVT
jgi:hypothetical protein